MWTYKYVGEYLNLWRAVNASKLPVIIGYDRTVDRAEMVRALDRRINLKGGFDAPRGRKDCVDWFYSAYRDKNRLRDIVEKRIRFYQFETKDVTRRFSHLLSSHDD